MKRPWFKEWSWGYYPVSWQGAVVTLLLVIFLAHIFIAVDGTSHSASDTLYGIFPFWVPAILVWLWIASCTAPPRCSCHAPKELRIEA